MCVYIYIYIYRMCYDILDAHSPSFVIYFVVLILVGPLFTQLLFKAVLANCLTKLEDDIHNTRLQVTFDNN